jgi:DeoR family fructose operon transcriptional repressor
LPSLPRQRRLHVVTNNLALLPFLAEAPGIQVIGGRCAPPASTTGPLAHDALRRDCTIVNANGLVSGRGLSEDLDRVLLESLMMQQAKEVIVLADVSKLGRTKQGRLSAVAAALDPGDRSGFIGKKVQRLRAFGRAHVIAGAR